MKILVIGGGGREHAIAWRLALYPGVEVIATPGNPGIAEVARCVPAPNSITAYADLATQERVHLTVVGPEATLVAGIVDEFHARRLRIVGPTHAAAQLEGSKIFAKQFFGRAGIPTARAVETISPAEALDNIKKFSLPLVVKADGLAAGKGVVIARTEQEAREAIHILGPRLVIEEFLEGEEVSFIGMSNGEHILPLEASQDHKRIGDGDTGPNTGGMGAYSDGRILSAHEVDLVMDRIMYPAVRQMGFEGTPFQGFLYAGLMMTEEGPKVLEFNVRLGDPEAQALLHRMSGGFLEALEFVAGGERVKFEWSANPSVCVVLASEGYPEAAVVGDQISGLEKACENGAVVFQAGTKKNVRGELTTAGGRVLGVTASGQTLQGAIDKAYAAAGEISFRGMQYRRDIGAKGLRRW